MASLKELRSRIASVKSTQRITSAMKMVAAAKLKRAQENAESARPYADRMERMLGSLADSVGESASAPKLLSGTGKDDVHLMVVVFSDRGLCGGFNSSLARYTRLRVAELGKEGKQVKLITVGRKGSMLFSREFPDLLVAQFDEISKPAPNYEGASEIAAKITSLFDDVEFDICTLVYNKFISALTQEVTPLQLIPFTSMADEDGEEAKPATAAQAVYEYEPDEEQILRVLLPHNLAVQTYRAMLESFASEQGARMTAMDNATRNAGEMIDNLTIVYNRSRQAQITKELIEIISGAEAL